MLRAERLELLLLLLLLFTTRLVLNERVLVLHGNVEAGLQGFDGCLPILICTADLLELIFRPAQLLLQLGNLFLGIFKLLLVLATAEHQPSS